MALYDRQQFADFAPDTYYSVMPDYDGSASYANPLCGDEVVFFWRIDEQGHLILSYTGDSCLVCRRSCGILLRCVSEQTPEQAAALVATFLATKNTVSVNLQAEALAPMMQFWCLLQPYPTRFRCGLLPWQSLADLLSKIREQLH